MIKNQLPIYVARELQTSEPPNPTAVEDAISKAFVDLDDDIQQRFYDLFPRNLNRVTEQDIRAAIHHHPNPAAADMYIKEAINGSCACMVYLDGDDLYAANTGDSRVVGKIEPRRRNRHVYNIAYPFPSCSPRGRWNMVWSSFGRRAVSSQP